jgi:hypothetical protein
LSRFCLKEEEEEEGKKFRSLEVRRKLIALKNNKFSHTPKKWQIL